MFREETTSAEAGFKFRPGFLRREEN